MFKIGEPEDCKCIVKRDWKIVKSVFQNNWKIVSRGLFNVSLRELLMT